MGASLFPLALALGAELGVVTYATLGSATSGIGAGGGAAVLLLAAWFGVTLAARERRRGHRSPADRHEAARARA